MGLNDVTLEEAYERLAACGDPAIAIHVIPYDDAAAKLRALQDRADADALPLLGVPFAVKDNIDVAGVPTTAACPDYAYTPTRSAPVVTRLEAAGAIPICKTNMDQFATGLVGTRSPYGTPVNPRHPDRVPGGSSSGSAVAVARGIVSFALGTDTAGSGRVPAAFCGIVGMKPTRGWLPTAGLVPAVRTIDCPSVFAASVRDGWKVLQLAAGYAADDPYCRPAPPRRPAGEPLRIGVVDGITPRDALPSHAELVPLDFAPFAEAGEMLYGGPWVAERYAVFGEFLASHDDAIDPSVKAIVGAAPKWSAIDAARAAHRLTELRRMVEDVWSGVDVIILPTTPHHPTLLEVAEDPIGANAALAVYTCFANLLDMCAVAVPPNLSVLGPAWSDHIVTSVAASLTGEPFEAPAADEVEIAVVGAHLRGLPLHQQLVDVRARFVSAVKTAPVYRLYALPGTSPPKPGMVRVAEGGASIEAEVYAMSAEAFGRFVAAVPAPLGIGSVELEDSTSVHGFVCEPYALVGARDITEFGGWRAFVGHA